MKKLTDRTAYKTFVNKSDAFLEQLLLNTRQQISDELRHFMLLCKDEFLRRYVMVNGRDINPYTIAQLRNMQHMMDTHAVAQGMVMDSIWLKFRKNAYQFAYASSQRAALNWLPRKLVYKLPQKSRELQTFNDTELGPTHGRAYLSLSRYVNEINDAAKMSLIMGEGIDAALARVLAVFPKPQKIKRVQVLRRFQEADDKPLEDPIRGPEFIDEKEWQEILDDYLGDYIPQWRDPKYELETPVSVGESGEYTVYPWQLENEITEDFVKKVSEGQVDAANKLGITQFVWVAVLDNKTDQCCIKRAGLTNTEIAAKLENEWANDECKATVPPAHFNCRCRPAPATDDLPEVPASNAQSFEEWLNS